jgi:hypothetical protein
MPDRGQELIFDVTEQHPDGRRLMPENKRRPDRTKFTQRLREEEVQ